MIREGRRTVNDVSLQIHPGERWVILGPNGCGKTTLLRMLALYVHPSSGDIAVNSQRLGTFDIRPVRPRIAYVSASLASELRSELTARDVVVTAKNGALETWWHEYTNEDDLRAYQCLSEMKVEHLAQQPIATMSSGEVQRVLLARALMTSPIALLLDEPTARLDVGGREQVVRIVDEFSRNHPQLPIVTVTHHVDEIPISTTHCALMKNGELLVAGPIDATLTSHNVSHCFDTTLTVERRSNGRFVAYAP